MRRLKQTAAVCGIAVVAALLLLGLTAAFPAGRDLLASLALRTLVWQRGFHLVHATVRLGRNAASIDGLRIADSRGELFLTVRHVSIGMDLAGLVGRSDRAFGLRRLAFEDPRVFVIHHEDGTWNFQPLIPRPATPGRPPPKGAPWQVEVTVTDGSITVLDPQAVVAAGKTFSIDGIQSKVSLHQGSSSVGTLHAMLRTTRGETPVAARLLVDDAVGFGRAAIDAQNIPLAPVVDAMAPTNAFVEQGGVADVHMLGYTIGYASDSPHAWHLSADANVRIARLRVIPLAVPVRDVTCALHYQDGLLSTPLLSGTVAGVPLHAKGLVQIKGPVRLAFAAAQAGGLEHERKLFTFSQNQPVRGPFALAIRIDGLLSDVRVAGAFHAHDATFAGATLPVVDGSLYYNRGHLTITALDLDHHGARLWAAGDFDVGRRDVATMLLLQASAPSQTIPFVANIAPNGTLRTLATVEGPVDGLTGSGYAELIGGASTAQAFFNVDPTTAFYGPARLRSRDGDVLLEVRVRHSPGRPPDVSGVVVARRASLHVGGGRIAFADFASVAVSLPSLDTTLDGVAVVDGSHDQPAVAVSARAAHLTVDGVALGDATLRAAGGGGPVHIAQATLRGPHLTADAHGDVLLTPRLRVQAAALNGSGSGDLSSLAPAFPSARLRGRASGTFSAALEGSGYAFVLQAHSADASIAGIPVRAGSLVYEDQGSTGSLLAAVQTPAARVWAAGDVANAGGDASAHLAAFTPHLGLSAIPGVGATVHGGDAVGFATLDGPVSSPRIGAAAAVRTSYGDEPIEGDIDLQYAGTTLRSNASRIGIAGDRATIDGTISNPASTLASARAIAMDVSIQHGDLASLNRFSGPQAPLTGAFDAQVRVVGHASDPQLSGSIASTLGTIRGVTFNDLGGRMDASPQRFALHAASVQLGSSRFALDGDVSRRSFAVRTSGEHVDMTDFNDFFGGKDVFAGRGDFDLDVASSGGEIAWGGKFLLDDAAFSDYPLGHIDADFYSRRGNLRAVLHQNGAVGAATVSGTARFNPSGSHLPDLRGATYRLKARLRDVDVAAALPLVHQDDLGLAGRLDADGEMTGTLRKPVGTANFTLRDGRMRRTPIQKLSGTLESDAQGVALSRGELVLPYLVASAQGRYAFKGQTISGKASLSAADLTQISEVMRVPGALGGSATADVALSGSLKRPIAAVKVDAGHATIYGLAFDRANINATYSPGGVSIGDTELVFAGNRGTLSFAGDLPLQLHPLALGPKDRPVELTMQASKIDLSVLDPLVGRYATLTGNLNAGAAITGNAGNPKGKGTAQIRYATVQSPLQAVPLTDVNADIGFEQDTITLRGLTGRAGGGTFAARGSAHIVPAIGLRSNAGLQFSSHIGFRGAQVDVPGWIKGTIDGDLSMTRSGSTPYVEGSVAVSGATIPFSAIYDLATGGAAVAAQSAPVQAPGVPELEPGHTIVYGGGVWGKQSHTLTSIGQPTPAPTGLTLPPLDVDVAVTAGNNVRVRGGSAIDLTTAGGIVIGGSLQSPTLDGQFYAVRGQVGYFDTNFRLVSGTVTFDHESGLLPTMDVTAVTNSGGAQITLHITGRVDNLNTDLSSSPSMSRDQIVATLLHAPQLATLTNATTPNQAQSTLTQTAQSYFNAQLSRSLLYPFEAALAQQLNIESLSLIFNSEGRLAVELRTKVTPTISAVYQTTLDVPVTQSYGVSYRLRDYLSLDLVEAYPNLSVSSTNTTTLNLQYQFH